jgi:hypothetical protein
MFANPRCFDAAPLRPVNADAPSCDYVDARAPRAQRVRLVGRWICAPDAQKPYCLWEVNKTGGESRRSPDGLRAA